MYSPYSASWAFSVSITSSSYLSAASLSSLCFSLSFNAFSSLHPDWAWLAGEGAAAASLSILTLSPFISFFCSSSFLLSLDTCSAIAFSLPLLSASSLFKLTTSSLSTFSSADAGCGCDLHFSTSLLSSSTCACSFAISLFFCSSSSSFTATSPLIYSPYSASWAFSVSITSSSYLSAASLSWLCFSLSFNAFSSLHPDWAWLAGEGDEAPVMLG
mmetsp:Transcript_18186/g.45489  ORF Transcript_18186/g.45489 Transcript_18186/m.45489 type:complete len:215 (+) Transcript_18186:631-1275(+)